MTSNPNDKLPVAVVGAGPVGLAAAAHLARRGEPFVLIEAGEKAGHAMSQWGHVQLFSAWRWCIDEEAAALLNETGWPSPDPEVLPTGKDLVDQYLAPLATHPAIAPNVRYGVRVAGISRFLIDKVRSGLRETFPFEIEFEDGTRLYARSVIDATGTWTMPNPLGTNGRAARGEAEQSEHVSYGIPDVLGSQRERFAGKRVLVVGSGHSAINNVLNLLQLQDSSPGTAVSWSLRRRQVESVYGGEDNDALPARGALGRRAREAVEAGALDVLAPFRIERVGRIGRAVEVTGQLEDRTHTVVVDEIIVSTGFRPDLEMLRELRLSIDPALESTQALGPLIDPNLHSCGTVPPHTYQELAHPEPGFFVIGAKSYGRAPTFLMATGYEQARSVVAHLVGDEEAARRVQLVLPETGVCGAPSDDGACCSTPAASPRFEGLEFITLTEATVSASAGGACCGGPSAEDSSACCVLDAEAKAAGASGCGCGDSVPAALQVTGVRSPSK